MACAQYVFADAIVGVDSDAVDYYFGNAVVMMMMMIQY